MSGFIPIVSTTPPPIDDDDDDFGDFMDSTQNDDAFADFPSPVDFEDDSYPSFNSPPSIDDSNSDGTFSPVKVLPSSSNNENDKSKPENDKEVETIFHDSELDRSKDRVDGNVEVKSSPPLNDSSKKIITGDAPISQCNGYADSKTKIDTKNIPSQNDDYIEMQNNTVKSPDISDNQLNPEDNFSTNSDNQNISNTNTASVIKNYSKSELDPDKKEENINISDNDSNSNDSFDNGDHVALSEENLQNCAQNTEASDNNFIPDFPLEQGAIINEKSDSTEESFSKNSDDNNSEHDVHKDEPTQIEIQSSKDVLEEGSISQVPEIDNFESNDVNAVENVSNNESTAIIDNSKVSENLSDQGAEDEFDDFADFSSIETTNKDSEEDSKTNDTSVDNQNGHITEKPSDDSIEQLSNNIEHSQPETANFEANFESVYTEEKTLDGGGGEQAQANIDDDDDFADFGTIVPESSDNETGAGKQTENEVAPFECDFGAFEDNTTVDNKTDSFADFSPAPENEEKNTQGGDDFGDFATGNDDDNDFADFGSSSMTSWAPVSNTVKKTLTVHEKVESFVMQYVKSENGFDSTKSQIQLISELMISDVENHSTVSGESVRISCSGELWDQLEDIDNTLALNFVWNGSGHNKHLLDSLGMHTQNILFSGTKQAYYVPTYYAAGLGMIDPNKGILKPMSAAEKITAMSPTEKNAPALLEETPKAPDEQPEWKTIADNSGSGNSMLIDGSWSRSDEITSNSATNGNPMDMGDPIPIISSSMDLDFFENLSSGVDGSRSSTKSDLIDPELLELTTAPTTEPPPPPKDSGSVTLSKILASIKSSNSNASPASTIPTLYQDASKWEEEENKLSPEARSVLQKLPDLSYMKSRTLVFPISTSRVNMDDNI